MQTVCMIPARLGSSRVKHKAIRYLGDKPLVCHVIDTCLASGAFDTIYLNSDDDLFATLVAQYGNEKLKFYKRPAHLAQSNVTNDLFMQDFLQNVECDAAIQVNPTSPFLTKDDILGFKKLFTEGGYDVVQSVKAEKIEGIFRDMPLNYDPCKIMPESQKLEPVYLYSSGIMGFKKSTYMSNMKEFGAATYGCKGKVGYFELKGFANIDIDYEEDFQLAEVVYEWMTIRKNKITPMYFSLNEHVESHVPKILARDGVQENNLFDSVNQAQVMIEDLIKSKPSNKSWSHRVINTESNSATLIHQIPGEGNRMHYHPNWNEWWYIVQGVWEWTIEDQIIHVKKGEVVFVPRGKVHKIKAIGDIPAIRLAVSREDVPHVYPKNRQNV